MKDKNAPAGEVIGTPAIGAGSVGDLSRVEKQKPDDYRLGMKPNGALVLQGYFTWLTPTGGGGEWRDLPTIALDE